MSTADHDAPSLEHREQAPAAAGPGSGTQATPDRAEERSTSRWIRRCWQAAAFVVAGAALFWAYLRLSDTSAMNSDSANILLMGWDMLHGNVLLHGWHTADVSVYTTELPQYALLESLLGLHPETAHVAAAMTYTLAVLLAVLLARSGTSGRTAVIRTLIAGGMLLVPQLGWGVYSLDMIVDHIGTSVPLLVIWLLLDRFERSVPCQPGGTTPARGWWVPVLTTVLLTWVLVADPIVLVVGVAPLALVGVVRFVQGVWAGHGVRWPRRAAAQWYPLSLACGAVLAVWLARLAERLLAAHGGFAANPVVITLTPWHEWRTYFPPLWKVLQLYGADYRGLTGATFALAVLHLVSVVLLAWAMLRVARRFFAGIPLVDQVLAVAILLNVVLYAISDVSLEGAHEIAIVAPFGAALAARALVPGASPAYRPGRRDPAASVWSSRLRLAGLTAGALVLAGYLAGLGYELTQPAAPSDNSVLASWLAAHDLTYGLAGYWQASSTTVDSDGRISVRALAPHTIAPYLWLSQASWYDPASHRANFIVIDTENSRDADWLPLPSIERIAGRPVRTYRLGTYIILVWNKNLLRVLPLSPPSPS